jgi:hypothetical protein
MKLRVQPDAGMAPILRFLVSPDNARDRLSAFIQGARSQLLVYDPRVSDIAIIRLLVDRAKAGVDVRIIGKLADKKWDLPAEQYPGKRLHVRAIIRDGSRAFLGSQSLRKLELEKRRETEAGSKTAKTAEQGAGEEKEKEKEKDAKESGGTADAVAS